MEDLKDKFKSLLKKPAKKYISTTTLPHISDPHYGIS